MSGINLDITEQKKAEQARLAAEEGEWRKRQDLKVVLQAIPAAVFIAEDAGCARLTANEFGHDLLRVPSGENASKSAPAGEAPDNFEVFSDGRILSPEELPIQLAAASKRAVHNAELELRFNDGDRRHLLGNALPLFDEEGEVRGAVGAFLDITERKHAEERLRQSEELFRGIYEHASTGIVITDWNGKLQSCTRHSLRC
jgi:PAS domain-containing protein